MTRTKDSKERRNEQGNGRYVPALRDALHQCITLTMVQNVVNTIYTMALQGHMPAARLFLQYAVGKPAVQGANHEPSEPEVMWEATASAPVEQTDQTVNDGEPVGLSPRCDAADVEQTDATEAEEQTDQTVDTGEPGSVSPRRDAVRVEHARANGKEASRGVASTPLMARNGV